VHAERIVQRPPVVMRNRVAVSLDLSQRCHPPWRLSSKSDAPWMRIKFVAVIALLLAGGLLSGCIIEPDYGNHQYYHDRY